mgnify:CR=1 FL=1
MTTYNVSFVGAGKVAGVLCRSLYNAGNRILRIVTPEMKEDGTVDVKAEWKGKEMPEELQAKVQEAHDMCPATAIVIEA